jgi:hypothetical protein
MNNFHKWFMNPLFSDILIIDKDTKEQINVHGLALSRNLYFDQMIKSIDNNTSLITKNSDDYYIFYVENIHIAKIFIKTIYYNDIKHEDICIDLENPDDVISFLDYAKMWLFNNKIFIKCLDFINENLKKILDANFDMVPNLTIYFKIPGTNTRMWAMYIDEITKIFMSKKDMPIKVLDWDITTHLDGLLTGNLIYKLDDPIIMYHYLKKFKGTKYICGYILDQLFRLDIEKINTFYELLDNVVDKLYILDICITLKLIPHIYDHRKHLLEKIGIKNICMLNYSTEISKLPIEIDNKLLVLEKIYPFKASMYIAVSCYIITIYTGSCGNGVIFKPLTTIRISDKLSVNNKTYEIEKIFPIHGELDDKKQSKVAYPILSHLFILKNYQDTNSSIHVYKIIDSDNWEQ